jgi:hypothetical protein
MCLAIARGTASCRAILSSRQNALAKALASLSAPDRKTFGRIAETMPRTMLQGVDHSFEMCRLCDPAVCVDCPVVDELTVRGLVESQV